jgi:hypothetical protein
LLHQQRQMLVQMQDDVDEGSQVSHGPQDGGRRKGAILPEAEPV